MSIKEITEDIALSTYLKLKNKSHLNYSLLGGDLGEIAYLYYYSRVDISYKDYAEECMERLLSNVTKGIPFSTYCNGLAGLGVGLMSLEKDGFITGSNEALKSVDEYLSSQNRFFISQGELDFLHGLIGLGFYFLLRYRCQPDYSIKEVKRILDYLFTNAIKDGETIKWAYHEKRFVKKYNIALSHGMSSIILFLCKLLDVVSELGESSKARVTQLLKGSIKYILNNRIDRDVNGCYFASTSIECEPNRGRSRLAWCYGDLGVLWALYQGGVALRDVELQKFSLQALEWTAVNRRELKQNFVYDACICHGTAGIAQFFKSMAAETEVNQHLLDAANYWRGQTLDLARRINDRVTFLSFDPSTKQRWREKTGLLEGPAGVAMSLLNLNTPFHKWLLL